MSGIKFMGKNADGLAKPILLDDSGNLKVSVLDRDSVYSTMLSGRVEHKLNFKNKTKGDLTIPHYIKSSGHSMILSPASSLLLEISQTSYNKVITTDNQYVMQATTTGGNYAQININFDLSRILPSLKNPINKKIDAIKELELSVNAFARGENEGVHSYGVVISIRNIKNNTWDAMVEGNSSWENFEKLSVNIQNIDEYVNDLGIISIMAHSKHPALNSTLSSQVAVGYTELDVVATVPLPSNEVKFSSIRASTKDGEVVDLTVEKDKDGFGVLRVIDSAPHAFDVAKDYIKVNSEKSNIINEDILNEQKKISALLEVLTNNNYLYKEGEIRTTFKEFIENDESKGSVAYEDNHIKLQSDDTESIARTYIVSEKIDLTFVRKLVIDWENVGASSITNNSFFDVVTIPDTEWERDASSGQVKGNFERTITELDVRHLKGLYYIRVVARNGVVGSAESIINVYEIRKEY